MTPEWDGHCAELAAAHIPGRDIWVELGGCPRSWKEAGDLYRREGVRTLGELVTKVLGPPVDPKLARRGDIVMADGALGICRGDLCEFLDRMQPLERATAAWRAS